MRALLGVTCWLLAMGIASAQEDDRRAQAQLHLQTGRSAYDAGDMNTALRELNAADELRGSPTVDYYLALVHDRMGHRELAARFYHRYLEGAPDAPNRAAVTARLQQLEAPTPSLPPVPGSEPTPLPNPPAQPYAAPPAAPPGYAPPPAAPPGYAPPPATTPAPQEDVPQLEAALHRPLSTEYQIYLDSSSRRNGRAFSDFLIRRAATRKYIGMGLTFGGLGFLVIGVGAGFGEFAAEGLVVGRDDLSKSPTTIAIIGTFSAFGLGSLIAGAVLWSRYGKEESTVRWYRHGQHVATLSFARGMTVGF
jgi:hypothetical protein